MALASTILDEIAAAVEGAQVAKRGRNDSLRRVRSTRDLTSGERHFTVLLESVPEHTDTLACNWRRMGVAVTVYYADTPEAVDRVCEDGEIIDSALWLLHSTSSNIVEMRVDGTSVDANDGLITVTFALLVTYDSEVGE